jgi:hypothetical protein
MFGRYIFVALLTCMTGFVLHVLDASFLQKWLSGQPAGLDHSWSIVLVAAVTALEAGIGLTILYRLIRDRLIAYGVVGRGVRIALILLATQGRLFRQLFMDQTVAGFSWPLVVHDATPWLIWGSMCVVLVATYERVMDKP